MEGPLPESKGETDFDQLCARFFAYLCGVSIPDSGEVVKKLDRLRRKFLWQGNKEEKGYCLVY